MSERLEIEKMGDLPQSFKDFMVSRSHGLSMHPRPRKRAVRLRMLSPAFGHHPRTRVLTCKLMPFEGTNDLDSHYQSITESRIFEHSPSFAVESRKHLQLGTLPATLEQLLDVNSVTKTSLHL